MSPQPSIIARNADAAWLRGRICLRSASQRSHGLLSLSKISSGTRDQAVLHRLGGLMWPSLTDQLSSLNSRTRERVERRLQIVHRLIVEPQ
jgi:hypothetical protein